MKAYIFNFHDVILLLTSMSCMLLSVFQAFIPGKRKAQTLLLAAFFANRALSTLCTLLFWSAPLKELHVVSASLVTVLLNVSSIAEGPLLYLYLCSLLNKDFDLRVGVVPHFFVVAIYTGSAYFVLSLLPGANGSSLVGTHGDFYFGWLPANLILCLRLITVGYGVLCIRLLLRYSLQLKNLVSNYQNTNPAYLMVLCVGFLVTWVWSLMAHVFGVYFAVGIADSVAIVNNYLDFVMIQSLFVMSIINANKIMAADFKAEKVFVEVPITPDDIAKISSGIEKLALHLEANINVESFASRIQMGARETSNIINKHFQTNFFEFINYHRVEAAKEMLRDETRKEKSITEIMFDSGFNSKTAFNRFFKRLTGLTPSEYRKSSLVEKALN